MHTSNHIYYQDNQELHGFLAYNPSNTPKPAVLVAHDWTGRNDLACEKAMMLAEAGYVGFALDMYGKARLGETTDEKMALIQPFINDRLLLLNRIRAAYDTLAAMPEVDSQKIAAIGFCFGGLCVLDLARSGAELNGVVSFHGLLNRNEKQPVSPIKAKILALHGYDDPMVSPDQVKAFCEEMTQAGADWQVHMYGNTEHAFTNPAAHDTKLGTVYNAVSARRAFESMWGFLREVF